MEREIERGGRKERWREREGIEKRDGERDREGGGGRKERRRERRQTDRRAGKRHSDKKS